MDFAMISVTERVALLPRPPRKTEEETRPWELYKSGRARELTTGTIAAQEYLRWFSIVWRLSRKQIVGFVSRACLCEFWWSRRAEQSAGGELLRFEGTRWIPTILMATPTLLIIPTSPTLTTPTNPTRLTIPAATRYVESHSCFCGTRCFLFLFFMFSQCRFWGLGILYPKFLGATMWLRSAFDCAEVLSRLVVFLQYPLLTLCDYTLLNEWLAGFRIMFEVAVSLGRGWLFVGGFVSWRSEFECAEWRERDRSSCPRLGTSVWRRAAWATGRISSSAWIPAARLPIAGLPTAGIRRLRRTASGLPAGWISSCRPSWLPRRAWFWFAWWTWCW